MSSAWAQVRTVFLQSAGRCALMLGFAGALLGALAWAYAVMRVDSIARADCLIAVIVAAIGAVVCLAGAMHYLDEPMMGAVPPWPVRWALKVNKRIIMLAQLAVMALAIAAAYALIFGFKVPGVDK